MRTFHLNSVSFAQSPLHLAICAALGAMVLASPAFAADPAPTSDVDQQFLQGMSEREAGDYEAAIQAFEGILSAEPTLNRARAELAVTYFRALNYTAAKAEAQKVLDDPKTPEGVKMNIRNFLQAVDNQSRKHVFTPYITFGFGHDDNINVGPSSNTINIGGAQLQLVNGAAPLAKNYNMLNVGLSHRYLSPNAINLFNRSAAYIWQSNIGYYRNDYFNSKNYDLNVLSASTGPLLVVAERWRMGVDFTYDYINLGQNKLADFYGVSPKVTWNVSKFTDITLDAQLQKREFNDKEAPGRDSDYQAIGISVGRSFLDAKLNVQLGARLFNEDADINRFSNDGYQLSAGASYRLTDLSNIYIRDAFKNSQFDGQEPLFAKSRDEDENRVTVGVSHRFSQNFVKDWTLDANITHTSNDANIPIYDYRRTQYGFTLGKHF